MKFLFIVVLFLLNLNAIEILVSDKNINYHQLIDGKNLKHVTISKDIRCTTFDKNLLKKAKYQARRFIYKGRAICYKDVQKIIINSVRANFGNIEIQRNGNVISENKNYIKIKNYDGKIIKIYKNGQ